MSISFSCIIFPSSLISVLICLGILGQLAKLALVACSSAAVRKLSVEFTLAFNGLAVTRRPTPPLADAPPPPPPADNDTAMLAI